METALHDNTARAFSLQLFADENISAETVDTSGDNSGGGAENILTGNDPIGEAADKAEGEQAQNEQVESDVATGAPESYTDFALPEGMVWDAEKSAPFLEAAKELGLSQENAQKLVDIGAKLIGDEQVAVLAEHEKTVKGWQEETLSKFKKEDIELANKTLGQFADTGFISFLADSGLSNHPEVVGLFNKIGTAISEGNFHEGTPQTQNLSLAERLYGK